MADTYEPGEGDLVEELSSVPLIPGGVAERVIGAFLSELESSPEYEAIASQLRNIGSPNYKPTEESLRLAIFQTGDVP